jgi:hypothetical protein
LLLWILARVGCEFIHPLSEEALPVRYQHIRLPQLADHFFRASPMS